MSMPEDVTVKCRSCGAESEVTIFQSINDKWPNAAKDIMTGKLFQFICPKCGKKDSLEYDMLFNDFELKAWIQVVYEPELIQGHIDMLDATSQYMPEMRMRIVHNISELRQKVTAFVMGRDDRVIELCKFWCYVSLLHQLPQFELECDPIYTANPETKEEAVFLYGKNGEEKYAPLSDEMILAIGKLFEEKAREEDKQRYIYDFEWAESFTLNLTGEDPINA